MEKDEVKKNLGMIPEIKAMFDALQNEIKDLLPKKTTAVTPDPATPAKVDPPATPDPTPAAKVEFDADKFTKETDAKLSAIEEKFKTLGESTANTINELNAKFEKTNSILTKNQELMEKILELPSALSTQKKKDGAQSAEAATDIVKWRKEFMGQ